MVLFLTNFHKNQCYLFIFSCHLEFCMYLIVCVLNILSEFITSFLFPSFLFSLITYLSSNDSLLSMLLQKIILSMYLFGLLVMLSIFFLNLFSFKLLRLSSTIDYNFLKIYSEWYLCHENIQWAILLPLCCLAETKIANIVIEDNAT